MNKKYALALAFLITLLIASTHYLFSLDNTKTARQTVILARVIDGDTFKIQDGQSVRLLNINAPEKNMPNAGLSKEFLKNFENHTLELETVGQDKYGRILARVYFSDYVNLKLIEFGMASKFLVDESELRLFAESEQKAILEGKGIWQHSPYFGCIKAKILPEEEMIILQNLCSADMHEWYLKDESRKVYYFDKSFDRINLHSEKGNDNATDLFWQSATEIWNNDRDTLYLFDKDGKIIYSVSYGY